MEERFHLLDQQIAKFTEFGVIIVLATDGDVDLLHLQNTSQKLAAQWPIVRARINLLIHQPRDCDDLPIAWQSKTFDHPLEKFLPGLILARQLDESLESLFDFECGWRDTLSPSALSMSAIKLRDACLLRFSVQHVLCDATGLNYIVQAYCSLLRGESLQPLNSRPDLIRMKKEAASVSPLPDTERRSASLARYQITSSRVGWGPVFGMVLRNAFLPPKRSLTCCIPSCERLLTLARKSDSTVTAHDLVMARLWKASAASLSWKRQQNGRNMYPPFSFALNIEKFLDCTSELHNRWVVVNVPVLTRMADDEPDDIVKMALHLRDTITNARTILYLQPVLDHYRKANGAPITPWTDGLSAGLFCSSWGKSPLYDMSFDRHGAPEKRPVYIQPYVRSSPFLRAFRQKLHNTVLTWTDPDGQFWIHGRLDDEVWQELDRLKLIAVESNESRINADPEGGLHALSSDRK